MITEKSLYKTRIACQPVIGIGGYVGRDGKGQNKDCLKEALSGKVVHADTPGQSDAKCQSGNSATRRKQQSLEEIPRQHVVADIRPVLARRGEYPPRQSKKGQKHAYEGKPMYALPPIKEFALRRCYFQPPSVTSCMALALLVPSTEKSMDWTLKFPQLSSKGCFEALGLTGNS